MNKVFFFCLMAAPALAQVNVQIEVPTISFSTRPALVEVVPGVQVVPDSEDEVYFVDNYYWHHRGLNWYRTREHTGGWVLVEPRLVPRPIVSFEPGRYRRWHSERLEVRRDVREEHHEEKHEQHEKKHKEKHHEH